MFMVSLLCPALVGFILLALFASIVRSIRQAGEQAIFDEMAQEQYELHERARSFPSPEGEEWNDYAARQQWECDMMAPQGEDLAHAMGWDPPGSDDF